jgi:ketosteroid isomerase-like protein
VLGMERIEVGEIVDGDDAVFLEFHVDYGLGSDAGQSLSYPWGYTVKVEQGRVVHFRAWMDPKEARRAAGVPE